MQDPGEVFAFNAPAAIKTAPHARLMNEMFGSYFFVLEPSRQTFYDMLGKVGSIDSAEVIDDKTVYTERCAHREGSRTFPRRCTSRGQ